MVACRSTVLLLARGLKSSSLNWRLNLLYKIGIGDRLFGGCGWIELGFEWSCAGGTAFRL